LGFESLERALLQRPVTRGPFCDAACGGHVPACATYGIEAPTSEKIKIALNQERLDCKHKWKTMQQSQQSKLQTRKRWYSAGWCCSGITSASADAETSEVGLPTTVEGYPDNATVPCVD